MAVASFVLWIALELPWYTTAATPRTSAIAGSANALVAGGWRWVIWLISLSTLTYLFLESVTSFRPPEWLRMRRGETLAAVAALDLVLVLTGAFLDTPFPPLFGRGPVAGQLVAVSLGAWVALPAAAVALAAAVVSMRTAPDVVPSLSGFDEEDYGDAPENARPLIERYEPSPAAFAPLDTTPEDDLAGLLTPEDREWARDVAVRESRSWTDDSSARPELVERPGQPVRPGRPERPVAARYVAVEPDSHTGESSRRPLPFIERRVVIRDELPPRPSPEVWRIPDVVSRGEGPWPPPPGSDPPASWMPPLPPPPPPL